MPRLLLYRHLAHHRDADVQRAAGGVAADQFAVVRVGQREQAAREWRQPPCIGIGQRQRQREGQRPAPQAARSLRLTASALWPSVSGIGVGKKWRPSTSMSVEIGQRHAGRGLQHRAVIADAHHDGASGRAPEVARDQVELAHRLHRVRGGSMLGAAASRATGNPAAAGAARQIARGCGSGRVRRRCGTAGPAGTRQ
jgi:hypothetical protein